MKIGVFGAGGVGGYFGGRLAHAGEDVVFVARGKHLKALQSTGLHVESIAGDFWINPVAIAGSPEGAGIMDVILLGVKAWQVPEAAEAMRPMVGSETFIVPLLNGIEAPSQLIEVFGEKHVLGGLCRISSFIAEPGHIKHVGIDPYIAFGELDGERSQRSQLLLDVFLKAGVKAEIPADIQAAMWTKFAFIATISGVAGVTRAALGVLRRLPETRSLLASSLNEIAALAEGYHIHLPPDFISRTMDLIDGLPEDMRPSMQRDLMLGRPSELEYQNGAVVRIGKAIGVPTPVNDYLYATLLPQELMAREAVET